MKKRITVLMCLLLAVCFMLGACTPTTPDPEDSTSQDTTVPEEPSSGQTTPPEAETEPPVEVVVPDGEYPDLTTLLAGQSDIIDLSTDMKGKTVGQLKTGGGHTFVAGSLFTKGDAGLTTDNSGWDSVGYSKPVSTDTYTAKAQFAVAPNDRGGNCNEE